MTDTDNKQEPSPRRRPKPGPSINIDGDPMHVRAIVEEAVSSTRADFSKYVKDNPVASAALAEARVALNADAAPWTKFHEGMKGRLWYQAGDFLFRVVPGAVNGGKFWYGAGRRSPGWRGKQPRHRRRPNWIYCEEMTK